MARTSIDKGDIMPDWTNPEPFEIKALLEALLFAYPRPEYFSKFLFFNLDKQYDQIAPNLPYHLALLDVLKLARAEGWLVNVVAEAHRDHSESPKLRLLERHLGLASPDGEDIVRRRLEDIVRKDGHFAELMPWIAKIGKLGSQTCRIEYPVNTARGSGWLVGPDLVLTNWHVVQQDHGDPAQGLWNAGDVACRFDYAVTGAGTQAGTDIRLDPDWCVDLSPASPSETGTGPGEPDIDMLDYALIRLASPVGKNASPAGPERGWVRLQGNEALPASNDIVSILQYPDGLPLKLSLGAVAGSAQDQLRFFHTANTRGGSSGSLVLNAALDPVGLHHAGDLLYHKGKIGVPEKNQAVPLGLVANRLRKGGHLP
jgi:V8-like Glu-specific endopeptidase